MTHCPDCGNPLGDAPEAPQPAKPAEPAEQCWKCGDLDPAGHAKCNVPACGMREDTQPAKRVPLTDDQIERGREATFSTGNPFCPCDSKTMRKAVRWAERAHGIGEQP